MPSKASETFDSGIWAAMFISETSRVVSGVTVLCNIKEMSFFFSWSNFKIDVLLFLYIQIDC